MSSSKRGGSYLKSMGASMTSCSALVAQYGSCVVAAMDKSHVTQDCCKKEFDALKQCVQKHMTAARRM